MAVRWSRALSMRQMVPAAGVSVRENAPATSVCVLDGFIYADGYKRHTMRLARTPDSLHRGSCWDTMLCSEPWKRIILDRVYSNFAFKRTACILFAPFSRLFWIHCADSPGAICCAAIYSIYVYVYTLQILPPHMYNIGSWKWRYILNSIFLIVYILIYYTRIQLV